MAWTTAETERITLLETVVNDLQVAVSKLMSKQQMRQLLLVKQQELDALTVRVASLEAQVEVLQSKIG